MKTKFLFGLSLLATIFFGGCVVQSIQPLFAEKDLIPDPALVGTWTQQDGDKEVGRWVFAAHDQQYELTHTDEKGHKALFTVGVGKIGTNVFLDGFPANLLPGGELNDLAQVHLIGAHTFFKVVRTNETLVLLAMDYEWLENLLKENPKAIAHVMQHKHPILTASTEELQKFVAKYAGDEKVFKNEIQLLPKKSAK
ncbi:MAG TPA: hypothetical protein VGF13_22670 [Verrucomicrobiae bacterium]|jgi:hypothetical protein